MADVAIRIAEEIVREEKEVNVAEEIAKATATSVTTVSKIEAATTKVQTAIEQLEKDCKIAINLAYEKYDQEWLELKKTYNKKLLKYCMFQELSDAINKKAKKEKQRINKKYEEEIINYKRGLEFYLEKLVK